jgi:hypothetical protein
VSIDGEGIVRCRGKGVFRRQSVVRGEDPDPGGGRQRMGQPPVEAGRAERVGAAVQIEDHPVACAGVGRGGPLRAHAAGIDFAELHVLRKGGSLRQSVEPGAEVGNAGVAQIAARQVALDEAAQGQIDETGADAGHGDS